MAESKCRLTLIGFHHRDKQRKKHMLYRCECGKQIIALEHNVKRGNTKSCGCLRKEAASETGKKSGKYRRQSQLLGKRSKANTSGVTGVTYYKRTKRWYAELCYKKKRYRVCCASKEEAIEARKQMEIEFGIYEWVL